MSQRLPGRPKGDLALRERLLDAARAEFTAHGFRGGSMQKIAHTAGATPAMVHYYFGNKSGLYRAMLEQTLEPVLAGMRRAVEHADRAADPLAAALRAYVGQLAARPEIPSLLLRDVLSPDGQMRDEFVERFASRGAAMLKLLVRQAMASGRLRADLDVDRTALSLMSMAAFPFLAAPVVERVYAVHIGPDAVDAHVTHTLAVFYRGAGAHP